MYADDDVEAAELVLEDDDAAELEASFEVVVVDADDVEVEAFEEEDVFMGVLLDAVEDVDEDEDALEVAGVEEAVDTTELTRLVTDATRFPLVPG